MFSLNRCSFRLVSTVQLHAKGRKHRLGKLEILVEATVYLARSNYSHLHDVTYRSILYTFQI